MINIGLACKSMRQDHAVGIRQQCAVRRQPLQPIDIIFLIRPQNRETCSRGDLPSNGATKIVIISTWSVLFRCRGRGRSVERRTCRCRRSVLQNRTGLRSGRSCRRETAPRGFSRRTFRNVFNSPPGPLVRTEMTPDPAGRPIVPRRGSKLYVVPKADALQAIF